MRRWLEPAPRSGIKVASVTVSPILHACHAQICNHPALSYWPVYEYDRAALVHNCGKFRMLDRLLVKLHASGHRVLLFSTMTKLLDLLEEYLKWRQIGPDGQRMGYLRIDGSTSLEDRSAATALIFQHMSQASLSQSALPWVRSTVSLMG